MEPATSSVVDTSGASVVEPATSSVVDTSGASVVEPVTPSVVDPAPPSVVDCGEVVVGLEPLGLGAKRFSTARPTVKAPLTLSSIYLPKTLYARSSRPCCMKYSTCWITAKKGI